jgi:hypothetical protein
MPTSLVIAIYNNIGSGKVEYLFVNPGKYANENDTLVRLTTPTGQLSKEQAKKQLKIQVPTKFDNKLAQIQSPIVVRSPSGTHETWKSKVYIPNVPWGFVKGSCNDGEKPDVCAQREFQEETTLRIEVLSRFKKLVIPGIGLNVYQLDLNKTEKDQISMGIENKIQNLKSGEIFDYEWSHPTEKPDYIKFNPQSQIILDRLIAKPLTPGKPPAEAASGPMSRTRSGNTYSPAPFPSLESPRSARTRSGNTPSPVHFPSLAADHSMFRAEQWAPPSAAAAPSAAMFRAEQWAPPAAPHRRGGKTRRRKNGRNRRQTKKHI